MSYSHIPQTQISCIRCRQIFKTDNPFSMTCQTCHQRDIDYTVRLGNQTRISQIEVALMSIAIELSILEISDYRKVVLERLVAQLEEEKKELSKNI